MCARNTYAIANQRHPFFPPSIESILIGNLSCQRRLSRHCKLKPLTLIYAPSFSWLDDLTVLRLYFLIDDQSRKFLHFPRRNQEKEEGCKFQFHLLFIQLFLLQTLKIYFSRRRPM